MKSFTDLEQSKVLKDILPPESADMRWYREQKWFTYELQPYPYNESIITNKLDNEFILPAWSLVALLNLFPDDYNIVFNRSFDENTKSTRWMCEACDGISITFKFSWYDDNLFDISYDSPIDACYNMICFLHKEGVLNFNKK